MQSRKDGRARARHRGPDLTRWMTYGALVVAIAVLALLVYIAYSLLVAPKVPRTALERNIMQLETIVEQYPQSPHAWSDYIHSLVDAGLFSRAAKTIEAARSSVGTAAAVSIEEARLLHAQGDIGGAKAVLETALVQAQADYDRALAEAAAKGLAAAPKPVDLVAGHLLRAAVTRDLGDLQAAIDSYTRILDLDRTKADIRAARGEAYLDLGDAASARDDFEETLRFIPDFEPALEGLKRVEEVQGK